MFKSLPKTFAALGLACAVALAGLSASTTQARAHDDNLRTFLGAAAGLVLLGTLIENQNTHRHYAPVTRYALPPATPRLVLPGSCYNRFQGPDLNLRAFGAPCLINHTPHVAYLPNSCRERIFTYQGWRDVYDAQCLYRHGWVRP